jgi:hypothetical protein
MRKWACNVGAALLMAACQGSGGETGAGSEPSTGSGSTGTTTGATETGETGSGTGESAPTTGDASTGSTTGPEVGCGETAAPDEPIPWDKGQPDISACAPIRGLREVRAIMHLHSHHSHDACDGEPQPNGVPDEDCLADLRAGLCTTRIDVAMLSDHPAHASEAAFEELLLMRGMDEPVLGDRGKPIASWLRCPDGHKVLVMPGIESQQMMPLGLEEHVTEVYGTSSPAAFAAIKEAGALAWVAHTEGRDVAELATLGLDGIELYQLHANLDPEIRKDHLGLPEDDYLAAVIPFFLTPGRQPDLATLGFLLPNEPSLVALETLGQSQRLTISAGTDAHQNVFNTIATDGERGDSYRRMIRWFNNRIRAAELTPAGVKAALRAGNNHIVFESLGSPLGFDFYGEGAAVVEMGAEVSLAGGPLTLRASLPTLDPRSPQGAEAPATRGVLYRAIDGERVALKTWSSGQVELEAPGPGVYRVEVWITPRHLLPYLGDAPEYAEIEAPWIYSGALFVRP